jgi:RNA polymerase sigma-70 factor (ECF subfamily)
MSRHESDTDRDLLQRPGVAGRLGRGSGSARAVRRLDDVSLLKRYEAGDHQAFEELFRRYRQPLYRFILRFLRDEDASRDALQDVFVKLLRDPGRFEARSRFSTWLHAVARNLCLDLLRKRRLRNHPSLSEPLDGSGRPTGGPPLVERIAAEQPPTDLEAGRRPLRLQLLVAIRSIPAEQRQVFLLRELAGLGFAEIARELQIPTNTAKSRMRYALINLRRALRELGMEPADRSCP